MQYEASLRIAEESAPSLACQWHPQTWQEGRRSSVRSSACAPIRSTSSCLPLGLCPSAHWYSVSVEISPTRRRKWSICCVACRWEESCGSRSTRCQYVGTPGAQPRSWSEWRIARQQGAEFAQTALARAIRHRRIDELKKVLRNVQDIEFSDTTCVKRAMKLLGQL